MMLFTCLIMKIIWIIVAFYHDILEIGGVMEENRFKKKWNTYIKEYVLTLIEIVFLTLKIGQKYFDGLKLQMCRISTATPRLLQNCKICNWNESLRGFLLCSQPAHWEKCRLRIIYTASCNMYATTWINW